MEPTLQLKVGENTYPIGGSLYPTATARIQVFLPSSTAPICHDLLAKRFDEMVFERGHCYSNTEQVISLGHRLGLRLEFYAGWLFFGENAPIHHAWAVLDGNVIDVSVRQSEREILRQVDVTKPNWREVAAKLLQENQRTAPPLHEDTVFGQVPETLQYVGCRDTKDNAIKIFNDMIDAYPNHPSYLGRIQENGGTKLQNELRKRNHIRLVKDQTKRGVPD